MGGVLTKITALWLGFLGLILKQFSLIATLNIVNSPKKFLLPNTDFQKHKMMSIKMA